MGSAGFEERDALVIGGNTAGLIVAYFLGQYGFRTVVLERAPLLGGIDGSFQNRNGRTFDHGLHVLDFMRSELTTRLFGFAVDGEVNRIERRRAIVLRNHLIPYNAAPQEWPGDLRALLPSGDLVDGLGADSPTRENLARYYGRGFVDLIFDEALASYPSDHRHLSHGVDESLLVRDVYPWFFPRARRQCLDTTMSRQYQDKVREQQVEYLLYPKRGGFGGFIEGFRQKLLGLGVEVLTELAEVELEMDGNQGVRSVRAGGREFAAPRVYWCAPIVPLCELLSRPVPDIRPDRFVLGSFEFRRPLRCQYNELIVADPEHHINRMSFPGKFALEEDNLVQIEFAFPIRNADFGTNTGVWMEDWMGSLRRLGIVQGDNEMVDFCFKSFPAFYNTFGIEGQPMPEIVFDDIPETSNLRPVLPSYRNTNINTRVPRYLKFMVEDLA